MFSVFLIYSHQRKTMQRYYFLLLSLLVSVHVACAHFNSPPPVLSDAHITGHVVERGGKHLSYSAIRLIPEKGEALATTTDATGHFFLKNLKEGTYRMEASALGFVTASKQVQVVRNRTVEVQFELLPDVIGLEQVVVTGNKNEAVRRKSSSLVQVMSSKLLTDVGAVCLADGLNFQPGVRVENDCQNCGFTQVRINGLDGHYSQILMNSRPVFSALAGVYGLEQIPTNMIERVEVMRGGGSALFGSSAIGGTINVITKDPSHNSAEFAHTFTSIGLSNAFDQNTTLNGSIVSDNQKLGAFIYAQSRNRKGYDDDGDGFTEVPELKSQTVGIRSFMRTGERSKLTLEYHTTHEYRRGGDQLKRQPHDALVAEQTEHNIHAADATFNGWTEGGKDKWNIFTSLQSTARKSYYGSNQDPNAYGRTTDLVIVSGGQFTHRFDRCLFMPAELVTGVEYNHNYLHDVTLGYDHDALQRVHIFSGYLQNEWRKDRWGFLLGARLDKHSLIDHVIVSPRANIRFNPSRDVNFRLSYSTGFRSPQAYDEDFHVAVVGGDRVVTVLADNLKEESSQSVSASVDWYHAFGSVQTNLLVEGFFTDLSDVFVLRQLDQVDAHGNQVLERQNGDGARVWGVNVEGRAAFGKKWQAQMGVTYQQSRYKHPELWSDNPAVPAVRRLFRTPDTYGCLTLQFNPTKRLSFSAHGTCTGKMMVQHMEGSGTSIDCAVRTPIFVDMGLKASYEWSVFNYSTLTLTAGVQNLFNSYQKDFDQGPDRDSGYIYGPTLPRSAFVGLKLSL